METVEMDAIRNILRKRALNQGAVHLAIRISITDMFFQSQCLQGECRAVWGIK